MKSGQQGIYRLLLLQIESVQHATHRLVRLIASRAAKRQCWREAMAVGIGPVGLGVGLLHSKYMFSEGVETGWFTPITACVL